MSKFWESAERALMAGEELGVENVLAPLMGLFDEDLKARIQAMRVKDPHFVGADLAEALLPKQAGEGWTRRWGRGALGLGMGMAVDPLTYVAPGATKLGKAAAVKAGLGFTGVARRVPKNLVSAVTPEMIEKTVAYVQLHKRSGEEVLGMLRALGGKEGQTRLENLAIRAYWEALPLELPTRLQDKFAQGMLSVLRFEVPFTRVEFDLSTALKQMHMENVVHAVDYPLGKTIGAARDAARRLGAMTGVGRVVSEVSGVLDRAFGGGWSVRPGLRLLGKRFYETLNSNRGVSAQAVADKFALQHAEVLQRAAAELGVTEKEVREKVNKMLFDLTERTRWDPKTGTLRMSFSEVVFGRLPGGRPHVVAFDPIKDPDVDKYISEALDSLFPSDPNLGGPISFFSDSEAVRATREAVVQAHTVNVLQAEKEWQGGRRFSKLWGSGGYMLHQQQLKATRFYSDVRRKFRVIVPEVLQELEPRLRSTDKMVWTDAFLFRIRNGDMQSDSKFAQRVWDEIRGAVKIHKKTHGRRGISVDEVERLVHNFTGEEVNRFVWNYGLTDDAGNVLIPKETEKNFMKLDVVDALTMRVASSNAMLIRDHFTNTVHSLGTVVKHPSQVPKGFEMVRDIPALRGVALPKNEARFVESVWRAHSNQMSSVDKFLQWYDVPLRHWKAHTLGIFPAYHLRNFLGNMWQNWLGGVSTADNLAAAWAVDAVNKRMLDQPLRVGSALRGAKNPVFKHPVAGEEITLKEIFEGGLNRHLWSVGEMAEALGSSEVAISRLFNAEQRRLRWAAKRRAGGKVTSWEQAQSLLLPDNEALSFWHVLGIDPKGVGWKKIQPEVSPFIRGGFEVGTALENQAKMAHVISRLRRGDSLDDAITSAKKHLFDYSDLTPFEQKALRRVFPFYSWSRNNIPMQLLYLVKRPYRAAQVPRTARAVQQGTGVYNEPLPPLISEWFRKSGAIRWRKGKDGKDYFVTPVGTVPLFDLVEGLDLLMWTKGNLAPFPARVIEQLANKDLMTGRAIDLLVTRAGDMRYLTEGEKKRLLGVQIPRRIQHDVRNTVRLVRFWDDFLANPEGLDLASRIMRAFFPRDYPYSLDRSRASFSKALTDLESNYRKAIKSAASYGEIKDTQRIAAQYAPAVRRLVEQWRGGGSVQ